MIRAAPARPAQPLRPMIGKVTKLPAPPPSYPHSRDPAPHFPAHRNHPAIWDEVARKFCN